MHDGKVHFLIIAYPLPLEFSLLRWLAFAANFYESSIRLIFEVTVFYHVSWWQNPFFDDCWPIASGVLPVVKVSFRLITCMDLTSLLTNLEVLSFLTLLFFPTLFHVEKVHSFWLLNRCFWSSSFCKFQLDTMYIPDFTVNESRSHVSRLLSFSTLFHDQSPIFDG